MEILWLLKGDGMHILHYAPHGGGHMHEWHHAHFLDELIQAGHHVKVCNPVSALGRKGSIAEYSEILVNEARQINAGPGPHMFFTLVHDSALDPGAVDFIRKLGIPCVIASTDDLVAPFQVKNIGRHFDLFWSTYLGAEKTLMRYGCNVIYLPMAANPLFFRPRTGKRSHSLCFVGSNNRFRPYYIAALSAAGVSLKVRGTGWVTENKDQNALADINAKLIFIRQLGVAAEYLRWRTGRKLLLGAFKKRFDQVIGNLRLPILKGSNLDMAGPLPTFDEMASFYSSFTASLGIVEAGSTFALHKPIVIYHLREFEATMSGCAHLVRKGPDLERCFEDGKEIIFYSSIGDCVEKARFYLAPERLNLCLSIGAKARARAERDHTWLCRFKVIWQKLGLST
jgi:hypothetical protein